MKTIEVSKGVKLTNKNYLVDLDVYTNREMYYQGTSYKQVLSIDRNIYPNLLKDGYNNYYDTELDAIIDKFYDGIEMTGIKLYRKGSKIK